jgi:hypothetical protein
MTRAGKYSPFSFGGEGGIRKQRTIHEDQQLGDYAETASSLQSPPTPVFTFRFATTRHADSTHQGAFARFRLDELRLRDQRHSESEQRETPRCQTTSLLSARAAP